MTNEQILFPVIEQLYTKLKKDDFVIDASNSKTVEIIAAKIEGLNPFQQIIDFKVKKTNEDYCKKELNWYLSKDRSIIGYVDNVKIWQQVCSKNDKKEINSNYGWCIYSKENGDQFNSCLNTLLRNKESRQATMMYNRPSMHTDYSEDGKSDFICTYYNQFFIRNNKLISIYNMRSNDLVYGALNDIWWACYVYQQLFNKLKETYADLEVGELIWEASSLHVYERHFSLLEKIYLENRDLYE